MPTLDAAKLLWTDIVSGDLGRGVNERQLHKPYPAAEMRDNDICQPKVPCAITRSFPIAPPIPVDVNVATSGLTEQSECSVPISGVSPENQIYYAH